MKEIMNTEEVRRSVRRLAMESLEGAGEELVLIGIRTRGVVLAERIAAELQRIEGIEVPVGILDIALYRDDLLSGGCDAVFKGSEIGFDLTGRKVVLCDDVLFTGRTVRAALAALSSLGRADTVRLCVLVDRGHRELPYRADFVGKNVPTSLKERIEVRFSETDGEDGVYLFKEGERAE